MNFLPLPLVAALVVTALPAQRADSANVARTALRHAGTLLQAGDTAAAADRAAAARVAWPRQPAYRLTAARLAALAGRPDAALDELAGYVTMGGGWLPDDQAFATLHHHPRYRELVDAATLAPMRSRLEVVLPRTVVHVEGVASDERGRRLLLSAVSPAGVVVVDADGEGRLAIDGSSHGLGSFFGIAVDTGRQRLWVTTGPLPGAQDTIPHPIVAAFDLASFAMVGQWTVPSDGQHHHLGEVVVAPDGTVWITDSVEPALWRVSDPAESGVLERAPLRHPDWRSLQGIAFDSSGRRGWVADWSTGLFYFDLDDEVVQPVQSDPLTVTLGIDGLYAVGPNRLVAIQNGISPARIAVLELDETGTAVIALRVLDRMAGPGEPTLGVVTPAGLRFVANAPWPLYGPSGELRVGAAPAPQEVRLVTIPEPDRKPPL